MPDNNDELKKYLDYDGLAYLLQRFPKTTVHCTFDSEFAGETATLTHGTTTYTKTVPATSPYELTFAVNELGTWTLNCSYLGVQYSDTVNITYLGQKGEIELTIVPDGSTAEPVNSVPIWLKCANLNKSYTTLAEVLADTETYETLLADSNACQYMKRSTGWAYKGLVPKMTSDTTPSGVCTLGGTNTSAYLTFDNNKGTYGDVGYGGPGTVANSWFQYKFESAVTVKFFDISQPIHDQGFWGKTFKLQYSNDGTNFTDITSSSFDMSEGSSTTGIFTKRFLLDEDITATYFRIQYLTSNNSNKVLVGDIQFYSDVDITTDQDAMARLGKFDYACSTLLSNDTWKEAIINSDYCDSVYTVSVPKMTSNTSPSGTAFLGGNTTAPSANAYKVFNKNPSDILSNTGWNQGANSCWVGYQFTKPVKCTVALINIGSQSSTLSDVVQDSTFVIQGSNDNSNWTDLSAVQNSPDYIAYNDFGFSILSLNNNQEFLYYRLYFYKQPQFAGSAFDINCFRLLQFYGRSSEEVLVPLVPTMTSATTPSGEVKSNVATYSNYPAYYVFDGNDGTSAYWTQTNNPYIEYDFASGHSYIVKRFMIYPHYDSTYGLFAKDYKIEASNDGETWTTLYTGTFANTNVGKVYIDIENNTAYSRYRLYFTSETYANGKNWQIHELQFYAKTVQTNIIHSTPNDTIYMLEDGDPIVLATTNSDGDGILDFSQLSAGPVTLYSSVAKNPEDLTADYSKTITITKTQYGGTTEAYLMPDTIKTPYWFGYNNGLEDGSSANGWGIPSGYQYTAPTWLTNYIYLNVPASSSQRNITTVGTKNAVNNTEMINVIATGITARSGSYGDISGYSSKDLTNRVQLATIDSSNIKYYTSSVENYKYFSVSGWSPLEAARGASYVHAIWFT